MIQVIYSEEPKFPAFDQCADAVRYKIGDLWVDTIGEVPTQEEVNAFLNPVIIPKSVTMRQARLELLNVGLLNKISDAINSLPSTQKEAALIEWEYSNDVQRDRGLVNVLGSLIGMTALQIDQLFIAAEKL